MPNSNSQAPMYAAAPLNVRTPLEEEDEDIAGGYEDGAGSGGGVDGVRLGDMYVSGGSDYSPMASGGADQLTLSFQGEVYVFDAVSPDKVQAVLLLLGGYEIPSGIPAQGMAPQRSMSDTSGRSVQPQRAASLSRFREKRKERCFDKKIRYNVRKEVALRMQRKKGQFASSKASSDEVGSASSATHGSGGQDESLQETLCSHCGISSKLTPMMRRGPAGPRTLCNACGLKWANKGVLRELSKVSSIRDQDSSAKPTEESWPVVVVPLQSGEGNGSVAVTAAAEIVSSSNGNNAGVTAET